jgi:acetyl esterase/lipase
MRPTPSSARRQALQLAVFVLFTGLLCAQAAPAPASMIPIWPGQPPGTESWTHQEEWYGDAMDGPVQGLHVRNVTIPGLSVYAAPRELANGTAAIVAPGGGFTSEAWEKEGTLMAEWLQQRGVTAFVLKYRLTPQAAGATGGRGAVPALQVPGASPGQQNALSALAQATANLANAATTARTALSQASLVTPVNQTELQAKAQALGAAEQALAAARAEGFARLQAGADKLGTDLVQALVQSQGGRGAAARGGAVGGAAGGLNVQALAVADGQQAMRYVKANAATWAIDPTRIGFVGFSAGGYIALKLAVEHDAETRPAFVGAVYACCAGSEVEAPADAPPLFLASAFDDGISFAVHAGLLKSWKAVAKPVEIHMYATGGHGFGMAKRGLPNDAWIERFGEWMRTQKLMQP